MASNSEECPTGILIDYIGNITVSISSDYNNEKELEDNFNGKDAASSKSFHGAEELSFDCQTRNISSNYCLGSELNSKKDEVCFSQMEWRSPSPTTMSMITLEASRIVDQLHTTLETSLWEEEFPSSSTSEDECFEDCSNELELSSRNVTLTKFRNIIEKSPCFNKENVVDKGNLTLENSRVIDDNSVMEGNSGFSKISICKDNSNVKSLEENCGTTENGNKNGVETEELSSLKSPCVAECSTTAKLCLVISGKNNLKLKKGKALTVESCPSTEKMCTLTEDSTLPAEGFSLVKDVSTLTEEGSTPTEEGSTPTEEGSTPAEEGSTPAEEGSTPAEEGSTPAEEGSTPAEEGSTPAVEGSTSAEEGATPAEEGATPAEEGATPAEEGATLAEEGSTMAEEGSTLAEEGLATNSCIIIEKNSIITKEIPKYKKICIAAEDNFFKFANFSNSDANLITKVLSEEVCYTNTDVEQNQKLNKKKSEAKITPSSVKSKLTKIFKTPSFKTPIKYKKLEEKENVLQECKGKSVLSERKVLKIGQVSSIKGILSPSNSKETVVSISKSSIKASLNKGIRGKIPFGRENKSTTSIPKDQAKEKLEKFDTPLKKPNLLKFQPALSKKTPVCKSYSVVETPNVAKGVRRSSSFQTRQIPNSDQIRRERSFIADSRPKILNSRMSLIQTQRIGNELQTPSKIGSYLPKSSSNTFATPFSSKVQSCAKESKVVCPSFGSAVRQTKSLDQNCPQVVGFKRPASTTSKTRFASRLEQPSPLPKMLNDSLSRRLFTDNTPLKRRI